ncbi:hypothetical protein FQZ97_714590 [compost metagenome]
MAAWVARLAKLRPFKIGKPAVQYYGNCMKYQDIYFNGSSLSYGAGPSVQASERYSCAENAASIVKKIDDLLCHL